MDTDTFILRTVDIYKDSAENIENRFDTSNYEIDRPLPIGQNDWINNRSIMWINHEKICWAQSKNIAI